MISIICWFCNIRILWFLILFFALIFLIFFLTSSIWSWYYFSENLTNKYKTKQKKEQINIIFKVLMVQIVKVYTLVRMDIIYINEEIFDLLMFSQHVLCVLTWYLFVCLFMIVVFDVYTVYVFTWVCVFVW